MRWKWAWADWTAVCKSKRWTDYYWRWPADSAMGIAIVSRCNRPTSLIRQESYSTLDHPSTNADVSSAVQSAISVPKTFLFCYFTFCLYWFGFSIFYYFLFLLLLFCGSDWITSKVVKMMRSIEEKYMCQSNCDCCRNAITRSLSTDLTISGTWIPSKYLLLIFKTIVSFNYI